MALLLAVASPELEIVAVTTVAGNQTLDKVTANAIRVLDVAQAHDIPVAAGADRALIHPPAWPARCTARPASTAPICRRPHARRSRCTPSNCSRASCASAR